MQAFQLENLLRALDRGLRGRHVLADLVHQDQALGHVALDRRKILLQCRIAAPQRGGDPLCRLDAVPLLPRDLSHFVHLSRPCLALYCPVAQDVHASFSGLAATASLRSLPAPHLTHDRRAGWSWKRPAWHEEHAAGSVDAAD